MYSICLSSSAFPCRASATGVALQVQFFHLCSRMSWEKGGKGISAALTEGLAEFRGVNLGKADLYLAPVDEDGEGMAVVDRNDSAIDGVRESNILRTSSSASLSRASSVRTELSYCSRD